MVARCTVADPATSAEGVRWQDSLGKIEPCWILQIKVADTRTNHTAGFWSVHATPGRAHTARMYILMFYVSDFLTGYAARMVRLSVKNRYRYSKHVNYRVFPAELPHYTPNTREYAT